MSDCPVGRRRTPSRRLSSRAVLAAVSAASAGALILTAGCTGWPAATDAGAPGSQSQNPATTLSDSFAARSPGASTPVATQSIPTDATVTIYGADVDAPGAAIPLVATVRGAAADETVDVHMSIGGAEGTCEGPQWRHAAGLSQMCWITLPRQVGTATATSYALLSSARGMARTKDGSYAVRSQGPVTEPVTGAERNRTVHCGNPGESVWLTFDDGFPSQVAMRAVLDALRADQVKGRFFATGNWARDNPQMLSAIRAEGHRIENHSSSHEWLNALDASALEAQIASGPSSDDPKLLRPGYGAGAFARRIQDAATAQGYRTCFWTVDPRDWAGPSADVIERRVLQGDEKTPPVSAGGVVLLHMTGTHTAEALPGVIAGIRRHGLTLDPL